MILEHEKKIYISTTAKVNIFTCTLSFLALTELLMNNK